MKGFIGKVVVLLGSAGALAGVAVGILYAPASGQSTRRRLRRKLDNLREEATDRFDDFGRKARRRLAEIREG